MAMDLRVSGVKTAVMTIWSHFVTRAVVFASRAKHSMRNWSLLSAIGGLAANETSADLDSSSESIVTILPN